MPQEHLDRDKIDENGPFVLSALAVTVFKSVSQVVFGRLEIVVEHVFPPDIELVCDLLRLGIPESKIFTNIYFNIIAFFDEDSRELCLVDQ